MYKNEIVIYDNYAEVILCNKNKQEKARALISLEDIEKVGQYRWCVNGKGYVCNRNMGYLHQFIKNPSEGMVVDHKNHNKLDNRRDNLRLCTQDDNCKNLSKASNNTSGYKGVSYDKGMDKYRAKIVCDGIVYYLDCHVDKISAARAYDRRAIELYGEYANTNFPIEDYIIIEDIGMCYADLIDAMIEELGGLGDERIDYNDLPDII